jgi:hypothetical protein
MTLYEALYRRKCKFPINWEEVGERRYIGPKVINEAEEKVYLIGKRLRTTQSW